MPGDLEEARAELYRRRELKESASTGRFGIEETDASLDLKEAERVIYGDEIRDPLKWSVVERKLLDLLAFCRQFTNGWQVDVAKNAEFLYEELQRIAPDIPHEIDTQDIAEPLTDPMNAHRIENLENVDKQRLDEIDAAAAGKGIMSPEWKARAIEDLDRIILTWNASLGDRARILRSRIEA